MKKALIVLLASLVAGLSLPVQAANAPQVVSTGPICSMPPTFTAVAIVPQEVRTRTDRDVEIVVAGIVSVPDNCAVTAGYTLESSTGLVQGNITIKPDGSFSETFITSVSKNDRDKSGRVYNGTLFAVDADGDRVTLDYAVTVLDNMEPQVSWNQ
jgi:hypothetical protein